MKKKDIDSNLLGISMAQMENDIDEIWADIAIIKARLDTQQKLANAHAISKWKDALDTPNREDHPLFVGPETVADTITLNKEYVFDYKHLKPQDVVEHIVGDSGPYRTTVKTVPSEFHRGPWIITKVWRYNVATEEYKLYWTKEKGWLAFHNIKRPANSE